MKYYEMYMNRQELSLETHKKLLELGRSGPVGKQKKPGWRWRSMAALAACCLLALGVWRLAPAQDADPSGASQVTLPGEIDSEQQEKIQLPEIKYYDASSAQETAADIALPEGSFRRELTREQIAGLFREGQTDQSETPGLLFWGNYELRGHAIYDGGGRMFWLTVYGEHPDGHSFELELSPDHLPPSCLGEPGRYANQVFGVEVSAWRRAYDRDGDTKTDYICGSEFMAGDIGVRFENVGGEPYDGSSPMEAARAFNVLFVRQALAEDGGLCIDHLIQAEDVPEWRDENFATLAQARQEAEFAPYLPEENLEGYGGFFGRLTYQEDSESTLFVRWSRGYDDVEVCVYRPEGEPWWGETVDVTNPASYDTRLYEIPWSDSVPEEYREHFYMPAFRAEDMSLAVVEARGTERDTGGAAYRFAVLHPDGAMVQYTCSGLTAEQVWALVEPTLGKI